LNRDFPCTLSLLLFLSSLSWIGYESLHCRSSYAPAMSQYIYLMTAHLIHRIVISPYFPAFPLPFLSVSPGSHSFRRDVQPGWPTSAQVDGAQPTPPHFLFYLACKRRALRLLLVLPLPLHLTVRTPFCCTWQSHPYYLTVILRPCLYALALICPPWNKTCVVLPYPLRT
jgi:hypothetical protein